MKEETRAPAFVAPSMAPAAPHSLCICVTLTGVPMQLGRASLDHWSASSAIALDGVLRLKGFAAIDGAPARLLVQAVGPRLDSYFDRPWRRDEARGTALVVIGEKHMDRAAIEALLRG